MPNWKKVIVSGSNAILSNITASGDISASGDIYATNFIGTINSSSHATEVRILETDTPSYFGVVFSNNNVLYRDDIYGDFLYNPSTNTLLVDNVVGTASLATTSSYALTASLATTATTSSYALTASYVENGVNILGNTNNRVLTATGNNNIQGESGLTFDGQTLSTFKLSLNANNPLIVTTQAGQALTINDDNLNLIKIGDISGAQNETLFSVNDDATKITFYTDGISSEFNSTGLKTTGNITASGNVSASGDVYADNVRTDTIIFPNVGGKITTPDGQLNDDYITLDGINRYFEVILDADSYFKVDQNNELISLNESTKHGISSNDTHQFTGSVDIKGNTNIDGNLVINGDITAEQYIVNSTVTNVTMSFSSGSTIFGDTLNDTHLFTGSVDITGSLNVGGLITALSASIDHVSVNDKLQGNGPGFQFFAYNEDTVKVKFANWYSSNDRQYGMGQLWFETWFAAIDNNADPALRDERRIGFYLEEPNSGSSDADGGSGGHPTNARFYVDINGAYLSGSFQASGDITGSGNISASGYVSADHLILNPNTTTTGSNDTETQIDISLGDEEYKRGVIKRVFDWRENLASSSDIDINNQVIADIGEFTKATFNITIELKGYRNHETESQFFSNTASISQEINTHTVPTLAAVGRYIEILYEDGAPSLPLYTLFDGLVQTGNPLIQTVNNQIKFNVPSNEITSAQIVLSSSLTTVYLDYQLYK